MLAILGGGQIDQAEDIGRCGRGGVQHSRKKVVFIQL